MIRRVFAWLAMVGLAACLFAPFVWMVLVSLHPAKAPIPDYADLWPKVPQWVNYHTVLFSPRLPVGRFLFNSVFVSVCVVAGQILITSMAAYAFARIPFRGSQALFWCFLGSMMFAGVVTAIPVYLLMRGLHWLDSYMALIVPGLSGSFNVFLLRQFMLGLPKELDEAAFLDGAGHWRVFSQIVLPLSKPALATAGCFTFFAVWTDFFWPLLATDSIRMRTLEVGLSVFKNSYGTNDWPLQMAAAVVTLIPVLLVFAFAQRWFVRGIQMSGIK